MIFSFFSGCITELSQHLQCLTNKFLTHDLQNLVLLQSLTGHVQRKVITVHHTAQEVQVSREQIIKVILNQHLAHVETDSCLTGIVVIVKLFRIIRNKKNTFKFNFTLCFKMDPILGRGAVASNALVEGLVLVISHFIFITRPDSNIAVDSMPIPHIHLLGLRTFLFLLFLHLQAILFCVFGVIDSLLIILLVNLNHLLRLLVQTDRKGDKFGVLLNHLLQALLLHELVGIILQKHGDLSSTAEGVSAGILGDGERGVSSRLPNVLVVVIILGDHAHLIRHQIHRVETHTKLSNQRHVLTVS
mmetsp:Transcript_24824/g.42027  ORF Transcript_24824/g.42027 Transcript_24824/m.42027 type:complete len:302 (+) Transcript_24824:1103-2008(+)